MDGISYKNGWSKAAFRWRHETVYVLAVVAFLAVVLLPAPWQAFFSVEDGGDVIGGPLVLAGIAMRLWACLYIGGRKNRMLVQEGPYTLVRNPLYLGNLIIVLGIVCLVGSFLVALIVLPAFVVLYGMTIRAEEARLSHLFGAPYDRYRQDVPRLLPHLGRLRLLLADTQTHTITHCNLAREIRRGAAATALAVFALVVHVYYVDVSDSPDGLTSLFPQSSLDP